MPTSDEVPVVSRPELTQQTATMDILKRTVRMMLPKRVHFRLAEIFRSARRRRFPGRVIERQFRDKMFKIRIADGLAEGWYEQGWKNDLAEICFLERFGLKEGARVFDLGAHQGVVALCLAEIVGPSGQVVAVEADPWNAEMATTNQRLNGAKNVRVLNAAVGESDGVAFPHQPRKVGDRVYEWELKSVPFRSIDSLTREFGAPDVIYCDVDGFEMSVLRGARNTLQLRADWFIEVHVGCGLEAEASCWQEVVDVFSPDRFDRYVGSEYGESFVPFECGLSVLAERFFLIAIHRDRG